MTVITDVDSVEWRDDDFAPDYHFGWWHVGRQACCLALIPTNGPGGFSLWLLRPKKQEVSMILGDATTARTAALPAILQAYPYLKPRAPHGDS